MLELSEIELKVLRSILGALDSLEAAGRANVLELARLMHRLGRSGETSAPPLQRASGQKRRGRPPGRPASASKPAGKVGSPTGRKGKRGRPPGKAVSSLSLAGDGGLRKFLATKQPAGALQRTAVLGYYLQQNQKLPTFSNADIEAANKQAGAENFSNVHVTVNNAIVRGLLARAKRGKRKLTPAGKAFVEALPDRSKAQASVRALAR